MPRHAVPAADGWSDIVHPRRAKGKGKGKGNSNSDGNGDGTKAAKASSKNEKGKAAAAAGAPRLALVTSQQQQLLQPSSPPQQFLESAELPVGLTPEAATAHASATLDRRVAVFRASPTWHVLREVLERVCVGEGGGEDGCLENGSGEGRGMDVEESVATEEEKEEKEEQKGDASTGRVDGKRSENGGDMTDPGAEPGHEQEHQERKTTTEPRASARSITNIISVGLGTPTGLLRGGLVDRRSVSSWQLVALVCVKEFLGAF